LNEIERRIGHFSVRNINKRAETPTKNLHALRNAQRLVLKQDRQLAYTKEKLKNAELQCENIEKDSILMYISNVELYECVELFIDSNKYIVKIVYIINNCVNTCCN
jgi:hypothetical protein